MATVTTTASPALGSYKLELLGSQGNVFRDVLRTPPRNCDISEVPMIDLTDINGSEEQRGALAEVIRAAAENNGFFYIKNHGIPEAKVQAALRQAKTFFNQSVEKKALVSQKQSRYFNGWAARRSGKVSPTETQDHKEGFSFRYDPKYDPEHKDFTAVPEEVKPWIRGEDFVWEKTSDLPGFKEDMLGYWQECLALARRMIRIFALALEVPETHFDNLVTYPGSDAVFNYYPKNTAAPGAEIDVGIGAHTDLQCFTLLWQDQVGGLQVLTKDGQWLNVPPIPDTFVVNIGDFMMRLSNDRFQSTVHRVFNHAPEDRYSMPFFFGFNFNEKCGVLPTCISESNPAKYNPVSCGEWVLSRIARTHNK